MRIHYLASDIARKVLKFKTPTSSYLPDIVQLSEGLYTVGLFLSVINVLIWGFVITGDNLRLAFSLSGLVVNGIPLLLLRLNHTTFANNLWLSMVWIQITLVILLDSGIDSPIFSFYTVLVIAATLMSGWYQASLIAGSTIFLGALLLFFEIAQTDVDLNLYVGAFLSQSGTMIGCLALVYLNLRYMRTAQRAVIESEKVAKEFQNKLRALHDVGFELAMIESLDELYRQAVLLGVSELGFERISVLLVNEEYTTISGVYGTDEQGRLWDAQDLVWQPEADSRELELIRSQERASYWDDIPLIGKGQIVGHGWDILATLWDGNRILGLVSTDNYHTGQAVKPYTIDLMALYGGILGHLISRKRAEIELNKFVEQLKILQQIDRSILMAESPAQIAETIIDPLQSLLNCHFAGIARYDAATETIIALASTLSKTEIAKRTLDQQDIDELLSEDYVVVSDLSNKPERRPGEERLLQAGVLSYTIFPMRSDKELTGALQFGLNIPGMLSRDQIEIAQQVATQLAIVFRQNDLYAQLQHYATNLAGLVEERTSQLEAKTQELEAFNYSVSHDLRAPLRAISAFSYTLQQDYQDELPEKARFLLERININASRMGQLINGLLSLSRLGRKQLDIQPLDMTQMVHEIVTHFEQDNQTGNAKIEVHKLPGCHGDKTLIKQVWSNLISNALKYAGHETEPHIEVGTISKDKRKVFYVKDNGVGFDMEHYHRLFGVFERLVSDDEFEGTGIGLAIIKRIITRHHGEIWAESSLDQGATFYFTVSNIDLNK